MLLTTHRTTDMPMKGVAFATPSVKHFLEGVMKTDTQDFLGKMEGFAVHKVFRVRMEWKHYWRNIVRRYQVMIEGWPKTIPFRMRKGYVANIANDDKSVRECVREHEKPCGCMLMLFGQGGIEVAYYGSPQVAAEGRAA